MGNSIESSRRSHSHQPDFDTIFREAFLKDPLTIWHDPNIDSSKNQEYAQRLKRFCNLHTFNDAKKAKEFIVRESNRPCHVITAGSQGKEFVESIHNLANVHSIYVFCQNYEIHSQWARDYEKIISVETSSKIIPSLIFHQRYTSSFRLQISITEWNQNNNEQEIIDENEVTYNQQREQFFIFVRKHFPKNQDIEALSTNYNYNRKEAILSAYVKETVIYKIVNQCLARSNLQSYCDFIMRDLERVISEKYRLSSKTFSGVYYTNIKEPTHLKDNHQAYLNKNVEIKQFIIANQTIDPILKLTKFGLIQPEENAFLTIIIPQLPENQQKGFIRIRHEGDAGKEVLFNIGSIFKIIEISEIEKEGIKYPHVVLLYGTHVINQHLQEKNPEIKIEPIKLCHKTCNACQKTVDLSQNQYLYLNLFSLTQYLCEACIQNSAFKSSFLCISPYLYQNIVPDIDKIAAVKLNAMVTSYPQDTNVPFHGYICSQCGKTPIKSCFQCLNDNKKWCENCQEEKRSCVIKGHEVILETSPYCFFSGGFTNAKDRITIAQEQESDIAKSLIENYTQEQKEIITNSYISLGLKSEEEGKILEAFRYFEKASSINPLCSSNYIAQIRGEFPDSENSSIETLEKIKQVYGAQHIKVVQPLIRLGLLYAKLKEYDRAEEQYKEAFKIREFINPERYSEILNEKNFVQMIFKFLRQYSNSNRKQKEILEIFRDFSSTRNSLIKLGLICKKYGNIEGANECAQKIFESFIEKMEKSLDLEDKLNVTDYYHCLKGVYEIKIAQADKKLLEEDERLIEVFDSNSPQKVSRLFGKIYSELRDYGRAEKYLKNSENTLELVSFYNSFERFDKAIEVYLKALENLELSRDQKAQFSLGLVFAYLNTRQLAKAKENLIRVAEIFQQNTNESENNPTTILNLAQYFQYRADLSILQEENSQNNKAIENYIKSLEYYNQLSDRESLLKIHKALIKIYQKAKDHKNVIKHCLKELEISELFHGKKSEKVANLCKTLGVEYMKIKQYQEAVKMYSRAIRINKKLLKGEDNATIRLLYSSLAGAYFIMDQGNLEAKYQKKAEKIRQKSSYVSFVQQQA